MKNENRNRISIIAVRKLRTSCFCLLLIASAAWAQTLTNAECYFDSDPGEGNAYALAVADSDTTVFSGAVPTAGLTRGLHRFYIRYREDNGAWGEPDGEWFWASSYAGREINAAECFFDDDPGQGNGIPLAVDSDPSVVFIGAAPTAGLTYGLHRFYIRYRETNGVWGAPDGEFVYAINYGDRNVQGAECFFDNDPGQGNGVQFALSPDDTASLVVPVATAGLEPGLHRFYIRYRRSGSNWGAPNGAFFFIPSTPGDGDPDQAILSGAEYYVNWDPGEGNGVPLIPADGIWDEPIEQINQILGTFPPGRYWLGIRYRDSAGLWSNIAAGTFYVSTRAVIKAVGNNITLWWESDPGTQFSVFRAPYFEGPTVAVGSSTTGTLTDVGIVPIQPMGFYVVTQSDTNFSSIRIPPQGVTRRN